MFVNLITDDVASKLPIPINGNKANISIPTALAAEDDSSGAISSSNIAIRIIPKKKIKSPQIKRDLYT